MRYLLAFVASAALFAVPAGTAHALILTASDNNSTFDFDTDFGMSNWTVDGQDHLALQSFFLSVDGASEVGLGSAWTNGIALTNSALVDADFDPGAETLNVRYQGLGVEIDVTYTLSGGVAGSTTADIAETISIKSLDGQSHSIRLFQYSDFDLGGSPSDDIAQFTLANTVLQRDAGLAFSENTVGPPPPGGREINIVPTLLTRLNDDGNQDTLANTPIGTAVGPADVEWAFSWNGTVSNNSTFLLSKDKQIRPIPEPTTLALWSLLGVTFAVGARYRRRKKNAA